MDEKLRKQKKRRTLKEKIAAASAHKEKNKNKLNGLFESDNNKMCKKDNSLEG